MQRGVASEAVSGEIFEFLDGLLGHFLHNGDDAALVGDIARLIDGAVTKCAREVLVV